MTMPHNIYIHVPYCVSKCDYCAFYSTAGAPDWAAYGATVLRDIKYWGGRLAGVAVPTIFFGGGTPSLMPTDLFARIMDALHENFNIAPDAEITLESNPGTLNTARLREFMAAGANRMSVGVQSLNDADLQFLGRRHTADDARALIGAACDAGMRVSGDFIYALPHQNVHDVEKMCRGILDSGLRHVSLYELSIEPETPMARRGVRPVDDDVAATMYEKINEIFSPKLPRYEVSNYAAPGDECRHNTNIWAGEPYLGIGPGACGRIFINGVWYEQANVKNTEKWITGDPTQPDINAMSDRTRATEKIITGLRTVRGVKTTDDFRDAINWDYVNRHADLLIVDETPHPRFCNARKTAPLTKSIPPHQGAGNPQTPGRIIRATDRGMIVLDKILVDLVA